MVPRQAVLGRANLRLEVGGGVTGGSEGVASMDEEEEERSEDGSIEIVVFVVVVVVTVVFPFDAPPLMNAFSSSEILLCFSGVALASAAQNTVQMTPAAPNT